MQSLLVESPILPDHSFCLDICMFDPSLFALFTAETLFPVQEIRQLRLKQEGFVREISDLQETVEWKDKKIGVRPPSQHFCVLLTSFA